MRSSITRFNHHFFHALWKIQGIIYGLIAWLVVDAAAITYFEKMSFADALYFTFVTGLTIGYGDIAPVMLAGSVVAILTASWYTSGLIAAVSVYALRETMIPPTDSH